MEHQYLIDPSIYSGVRTHAWIFEHAFNIFSIRLSGTYHLYDKFLAK